MNQKLIWNNFQKIHDTSMKGQHCELWIFLSLWFSIRLVKSNQLLSNIGTLFQNLVQLYPSIFVQTSSVILQPITINFPILLRRLFLLILWLSWLVVLYPFWRYLPSINKHIFKKLNSIICISNKPFNLWSLWVNQPVSSSHYFLRIKVYSPTHYTIT